MKAGKRIDERLRYFLLTGRDAAKYRVVGIFPSGRICTIRDGFFKHRDAHNFAISKGAELHARFGIVTLASVEKGIGYEQDA